EERSRSEARRPCPKPQEPKGRRARGTPQSLWCFQASRGTPGPPPLWLALFLGGGGSGDRQLLDDLVGAPVRRIVAGNLQHEVQRLLAVALAVELDVAGDAVRQLGLADGRRDVLAARRFAALGRGLDTLERDGGGVVGLGRVRLGVLAELLLELVDEGLGFR